jgi:hypothetical protein
MRTGRAVRRAHPALLTLVLGALAGCGGTGGEHNYDLLFTNIEPLEYARTLCHGIPMQDQHTCMTSVLRHYRDSRWDEPEPSEVTGGPFVLVFADDIYRGTYVSNPFISAFTVSNGAELCRGRYDAFAGDTRADFRVHCDDGSTGLANIILDMDGRNGVGVLDLNDGRRGRIVFGHRAVGGDFL